MPPDETQPTTAATEAPKPTTPEQPGAELAKAKQEIETAAIALSIPARRMAVTEPSNFNEAMVFCEIVAASGMWGITKKEDAFVRVATGMTLGLPAIQSLNLIDSIPGPGGSRPALRAKLKVALCLQHPSICKAFDCTVTTDKEATYVAQRAGGEPKSYTYTIDEARVAGYLTKDNWKQNARAMLRARASSMLAEMLFPDITGGLASTEELEDQRAIQTTGQPVGEWQVVKQATVETFEKQIADATKTEDIDAAWSAVQAAVKSGDLTTEQKDVIKVAANARRKVLLQAIKDGEVIQQKPAATAKAGETPPLPGTGGLPMSTAAAERHREMLYRYLVRQLCAMLLSETGEGYAAIRGFDALSTTLIAARLATWPEHFPRFPRLTAKAFELAQMEEGFAVMDRDTFEIWYKGFRSGLEQHAQVIVVAARSRT